MTEEKVSPMSKGTGKRGDNLPRQELTGLFEVSMEEEDRSSSEFQNLTGSWWGNCKGVAYVSRW